MVRNWNRTPQVARLTIAAALAALAVLQPGPGAAQDSSGLLATWKDGEIRESFDAALRVSQMAVAVMPSGPQGSVTVVVSARWPDRARTKPLTEFELRADVGLRVNPNFIRQPTLRLILDPDTGGTRTLELSERLKIPPTGAGSAIDTGHVMLSLVELIQVLRARVVAAEIFGLPMTFTPGQLESLRRFGDRVLAPSPGARRD